MKQDIVCQFGDKNEIPSWKLNWRTVELFPVNMLLHNLTVIVATSLSFLIKLSKKVRMFFASIYFRQFSWVKKLMQKKKKLFVNLAIKKKIPLWKLNWRTAEFFAFPSEEIGKFN